MKTREEVENLKQDWLKDGCWDIETTEGFEEYKDELLKFRKKTERTQKQIATRKRNEHIKELGSKYCPMSFNSDDYGKCLMERCAWWYGKEEKCVITSLWYLEDMASASNTYNQIHN